MPVGPEHWGVSWLGYLLIAVLTMLLLGMMLPPSKPRNQLIRKAQIDEKIKERELSQAITLTFGSFFWLLLLTLLAMAVIKLVD